MQIVRLFLERFKSQKTPRSKKRRHPWTQAFSVRRITATGPDGRAPVRRTGGGQCN